MTSSDSILTLIQKLEQATEGSRELDAEIFHALDRCRKQPDGTCEDYLAPRFTESLDAALTLVPDGWYGRVEPRFYSEYDKFEKRVVLWNAYCIRPRWQDASPMNEDYFDVVGIDEPNQIREVALCIASLKALSHTP